MRLLSLLVSVLVCASAAADELSQAVTLGVKHLSLQELAVAQGPEGRVLVPIQLDHRVVMLELEPYSVRSENFRLVLDRGEGVMEEVTPPAPRTVRGSVIGEPGSVAAGSLTAEGLSLMLVLDNEMWTVQPAKNEGADVHAVFRGEDVLEHGGTCGLPGAGGQAQALAQRFAGSTVNTRGSGDNRIAEIAIDADWHLFSNWFGQNQNALLNDIDSIIAGMNVVYERDISLTHELTHVIIRTSLASNPYTTNSAGGLLDQFTAEWNTNQQDVQRDVAHMWTGRNMSGSTIGIAFLGTICTSNGYGVDQIRFSGNFNSRVALFSHELGHNWNADHCDGQSECRIMCSGLGGCNGLGNPVRFAPGPISQIGSFVASRSCVDNIGISLPVVEDFEDQTLDPLMWATQAGFDNLFDNQAPSGNRVGRLTPVFALLGTTPVDTSVSSGNTVAVRISLKPEASGGTNFRVDITGAQGTTQTIGLIDATDPGQGYIEYTMQMPGSILNNETPVRFIPGSSGPAWRFDDIQVFETGSTNATVSLPLVEDFERASLFMDRWQPSTADVDNDEPGVPSGTYSAALAAGTRMETADVLAAGGSDLVFGVLVSSPSDAPGDAELVFEYRDSGGAWHEAGRFSAASLPSDDFGVAEVTLPAGAEHNALSVAIEAVGTASTDPWRLDDLELGGEPRGADCPADLAEPFGVLDLADINAFIMAFTAGDLAADLAAPFGVLDLADLNVFISSFVAGCP